MKIIQKLWNGNSREISIAQMIELSCAKNYGTDGVAERAQEAANKAVEMLGRVVEMLHENGALTDGNIRELLPYETYIETE